MANLEASALWKLDNVLNARQAGYDKTQDAVVTHTDPDGTTWVHFPNGVEETPTASKTVEVSDGDVVPVTVENGQAKIVNGSTSNPAASMAVLKGLIASVLSSMRQELSDGIGTVDKRLTADLEKLEETVNESVQEAKDAAAATAQNFWHDDNGAHVTTELSEANLLMNAIGILLRTASHIDVSITRGAVTFYDSDDNVMASYTKNGIVIGKSSTYHIGITPSGLALYGNDGRTVVAQITGSSLSISGYATDDELDDVEGKADNAASAASDAAKVATNYLSYGSSNKSGGGLDVGFSGSNARTNIKTDGVRIYDQSGEQVAYFGENATIGQSGSFNTVISSSNAKFNNGGTSMVGIQPWTSGNGHGGDVSFAPDSSGYRYIRGYIQPSDASSNLELVANNPSYTHGAYLYVRSLKSKSRITLQADEIELAGSVSGVSLSTSLKRGTATGSALKSGEMATVPVDTPVPAGYSMLGIVAVFTNKPRASVVGFNYNTSEDVSVQVRNDTGEDASDTYTVTVQYIVGYIK